MIEFDFEIIVTLLASVAAAAAFVFLALRRLLGSDRSIREWLHFTVILPVALAGTSLLPVLDSGLVLVITNVLYGVAVASFFTGALGRTTLNGQWGATVPIAGAILGIATVVSIARDATSIHFHAFSVVFGGMMAAAALAMLLYGVDVGRGYRIAFGVFALMVTIAAAARSAFAILAGGPDAFVQSALDGLLIGAIGTGVLALDFTIIAIQYDLIGRRLKESRRLLDEDERRSLITEISRGLAQTAYEEVEHAQTILEEIPPHSEHQELKAMVIRTIDLLRSRIRRYEALDHDPGDETLRMCDLEELVGKALADTDHAVFARKEDTDGSTRIVTRPAMLEQTLRLIADRIPEVAQGATELTVSVEEVDDRVSIYFAGAHFPPEADQSLRTEITLSRPESAREWFALQFARRKVEKVLGGRMTLTRVRSGDLLAIDLPQYNQSANPS